MSVILEQESAPVSLGAPTLLATLQTHARLIPYKPAFVVGKKEEWQQLSYADLWTETERWARIWLATGAEPGSVVFLILQHCTAMYPAFLGALRAGLVPSLMPFPTPKQDPVLYWRSHQALFRHVLPAAVLTYDAILEPVAEIAELDQGRLMDIATVQDAPGVQLPLLAGLDALARIALLQHSSGTTGLKKGVTLTYRQIRDHTAAVAQAAGCAADDRFISWLPIYHDMGLVATFLLPLTIGATVISLDAFEWLARPDMFLDEIARFRATVCWLPNFAFNHLVRTRDRDRPYDLRSLRLVVNCSEPCRPETVDRFIKVFGDYGLAAEAVQVCYGLAEAVFAVSQTTPGEQPRCISIDRAALADNSEIVLVPEGSPGSLRLLSCGKPIPSVNVRIVPKAASTPRFSLGDDIADLASSLKREPPVTSVGEVQVDAPFVFDGYFRNGPATEKVFDGGWLKTGDMGFLLDGEVYICGRLKEMLIIHGRNFYANDIEAVVNLLEGIKPGRVVAVGVFDPVTGSEEAVILAETVLSDATAKAELDMMIRKRLFDVLGLSVRRVELAGEGTLVKTTSGKISRDENIRRLSKEAVLT